MAVPGRKVASLSTLYSVFTDDPAAEWYGYGLMRMLNWPSGKLYPLLATLEGRGLLTSAIRPPTEPGRPHRRVYRLAPGAPPVLPPAGD